LSTISVSGSPCVLLMPGRWGHQQTQECGHREPQT
jgi:hypothetical protein